MNLQDKKKKKRRAAAATATLTNNDSNEESSSDSEENASSDEDTDSVENINVEFEAQTPVDNDFHGIKQLLLRVFLTLHLDISELTDIIISQSSIGSTIKIVDDEEDEIYGIVSVLSLKKYKEKTCIKELKKELLSKCKSSSHELSTKLKKLFNEKNIGFIVNERFINIPSQIAVPFHNSIWEEVEQAKSEDKLHDFDYLMLLSKTLKPSSIEPQKKEGEGSKAKKKKKQENNSEVEYTNFEDELFFKESELSFSYNVTEATGLAVGGSWNFEDQTMNSYRTVMLIPTTKWKNVLTEIEKMVD